MKVIFKAWAPYDPMDPLGFRKRDNPIPTDVIGEYDPSTGRLQVLDTTFESCQEGDQPGQWRRIENVDNSFLRNFAQRLNALTSDPVVGNAISDMLSVVRKNTRKNAVTTAMNTLENPNATNAQKNRALEVIRMITIYYMIASDNE